jgi:hyperosmotically inducible protein
MKTAQLLWGAVAIAMSSAIPACTRAETNDQAREAAAEVRTVAARAGEHVADGWLTTKIQAQYFADREIKARHVDVSSRDGVVTLNGYVNSEQARQQAVKIAKNTAGVHRVNDQLAIAGSSASAPARDSSPGADPVATDGRVERSAEAVVERIDDARITTTIQAKYFLDASVKGRQIDVSTRDGVVSLRGEVASESERGQALLMARNTEGVERLEDNLAVNASLGNAR